MEKKNQHQKKELLASTCCWLSHSLTPTPTPHHRGELTPSPDGAWAQRAQPPAGEGKDPQRMERLLGPSSSPPSADHLALAAGGQCGRWLFRVPETEAGALMLRWAAPQSCAQLFRWHMNG